MYADIEAALPVLFSWWITQVQRTGPTTEHTGHQIVLTTCISNIFTSEPQLVWAVNTEGYYSVWFAIYSKYLFLFFFLHGLQSCIIKAAAISSVSYKWVVHLTLLETKPHSPQKSKILLSQFTQHSDITIKYKLINHKTSRYHANLIFWNNLLV